MAIIISCVYYSLQSFHCTLWVELAIGGWLEVTDTTTAIIIIAAAAAAADTVEQWASIPSHIF